MRKSDFKPRKGIVLGILLLLTGVSILPTINGTLTSNNIHYINNFTDRKTTALPEILSPIPQHTSPLFSPNGTITVSIRSAIDGSDLTFASKTLKEIPGYPTFTYTEFDFPDIDINAEETYFIVVQTSDISQDDEFGWTFGEDTNYTRGEAWDLPGKDFCFETYADSGEVDQYQYEYYSDPQYPQVPYFYYSIYDGVPRAQSFQPTLSSLTKVALWLNRPMALTQLEISDVVGGLGIKATIKNIGSEDAVDLTTSVSFSGGFLLFPSQGNMTQHFSDLAPAGEQTLRAFVLGFGGFGDPISITISAEALNALKVEKTYDVMIFLCFVIMSTT